ncbi:MAG: MotA/TolQ/ExbB proton channel family protein [Verrucomicrobiales bacterium]|jgi:biopolymer transport protein ExbB|nr:MotA/TolQ/ExbB proton channel family protein [Verrucomicrobiales bacterium]
MNLSLFEIIQRGGPVMGLLFLCSVLAIGVFAERLIFFHRCSINLNHFLKGITNLLRQGRYDEAVERCDEAYGPAVKVVQTGIIKRELPKSELREVLQEAAQLQIPRLESNMILLSTIASIAPLLGLLGTVIGMFKTFEQMNISVGAAPISDLSGGIWEALMTAAAGLMVAIPCYVAYNYLTIRLNAIVADIERAGIEIVQLVNEKPETSQETPAEKKVVAMVQPEKDKKPDAKPEVKEDADKEKRINYWPK